MAKDVRVRPNEWMHLAHMSNEKMLAMYRADMLSREDVECLHAIRLGAYTRVSDQQADRLVEIDSRVMRYDAAHAGELADDEIADMIAALGGHDASRKLTFRAYGPPGGWDQYVKDRGDGT